MTLHFAREVIIVESWPIVGTVTVETTLTLDRYDGLHDLDLDVTGFEPETPLGLTWDAVAGPCETWLAQNRARVEKKALRGPEPCKTHDKKGPAPAADFPKE